MKISVIIVSWNVRELIRACVKSLVNQDPAEKEIIVVDNASSDNTVDALRREFPQIIILANEKNKGFASAVNQGFKIARSPILFLLNPDTEVTPGALEAIVARMQALPQQTAIVGLHLVTRSGQTIHSVRTLPTPWSQALVLLKLHHVLGFLPSLQNYFMRNFDYNHEQAVEQVMGSAMVIRHSLVQEIGTFDEKFFVFFEEVDFCARALKAGKKILYLPDIKIMDHAGQSFRQLTPIERAKLFNASFLLYATKYWEKSTVKIMTILSRISMVLAFMVQWFSIKPKVRPR